MMKRFAEILRFAQDGRQDRGRARALRSGWRAETINALGHSAQDDGLDARWEQSPVRIAMTFGARRVCRMHVGDCPQYARGTAGRLA